MEDWKVGPGAVAAPDTEAAAPPAADTIRGFTSPYSSTFSVDIISQEIGALIGLLESDRTWGSIVYELKIKLNKVISELKRLKKDRGDFEKPYELARVILALIKDHGHRDAIARKRLADSLRELASKFAQISSPTADENRRSFPLPKDGSGRAIRVLIFDMGRTLYTSKELTQATEEMCYTFAYAKLGGRISRDEIIATRKRLNSMSGMLRQYHLDLNEYFDYLAKNLEPSEYLNSNLALRIFLENLKRRFKLAVVTNNGTEITRKTLAAIGIDDLFDFVMTQEIAGKGKPDPRMLQLVCEHFNIQPQEAVSIGDRKEIDIDSAAQIGMPGILVTGPQDFLDNLEEKLKQAMLESSISETGPPDNTGFQGMALLTVPLMLGFNISSLDTSPTWLTATLLAIGLMVSIMVSRASNRGKHFLREPAAPTATEPVTAEQILNRIFNKSPRKKYKMQGRTYVITDPSDRRYVYVAKKAPQGRIEEEILRREAHMIRELQAKGFPKAPQIIPDASGNEVVRFGGLVFLITRTKRGKRKYLTDLANYPSRNGKEKNKKILSAAALANMQDLSWLFLHGYLHKSLTSFSHWSGLRGGWRWDYDPDFVITGTIPNVESGLLYPNLRMIGIDDFEHVVSFGMEDVESVLGQNIIEFIPSVGYVGIKIGLSNEEITEIIINSIKEFHSGFYKGEFPESFLNGLESFLVDYRNAIKLKLKLLRETSVSLKELLPLLLGIRDLLKQCYKETEFFKQYVPYPFKYYANNQGEASPGMKSNQDRVPLWLGQRIVEGKSWAGGVGREFGYSALFIYDSKTGALIEKISVSGTIKSVAIAGNRIFVVTANPSAIQVFDEEGGYSGNFSFTPQSPWGVTVLDKQVFVSDEQEDNIYVYDLRGNLKGNFGSGGIGKGQLKAPRYLLRFGRHLIVIENGNRRIQEFDANRQSVKIWDDTGGLNLAIGAMVLMGQLFVIDEQENHQRRVLVFNKQGALKNIIGANEELRLNDGS
ncbi:MAG: hypothetical protein COX40_02070, partial [Candidatus Omnitrophica bacterium CG23_combo_of_CG06-09_8_20_14_all_40_11]